MLNLQRLYTIIAGKLVRWAEALVAYLPNFGLALLVISVFIFLASYVRRIVSNLIGHVSHNLSLVALTALIASRLVILVGVFIALGILGLDKTVASLLAGAGIVGLALGFAFQDLTANFLSGIFITIGQPIRVGDVIETNGFKGRVKEIKIRSTILDNFSGQEIEIPSRKIYENPITNYTKLDGTLIQVKWRVAQTSDLEKVEQLCVQTIDSLGIRDKKQNLDIHFTGLEGANIGMEISFWVSDNDDTVYMQQTTSKVIKGLKKAFDANEVKMG